MPKTRKKARGQQQPTVEPTPEEIALQEELEVLRGVFDKIDLDRSGRLDAFELQKLTADLGLELSTAEASEALAGMDGDGDDVVTFEEFYT
jgi:Ca2+-binding EF-hand superfamily protein